jgi:hypothetical protein
MPYDDLPNNGWGDPPKYDWPAVVVWSLILLGSIAFWIGIGWLLWRCATS